MDDIWQQFHRLPKIIRDAVATPQALETIDRLETENRGLDLAGFVMRVMVKEFPVAELGKRLITESGIDVATADRVVDRLTRSVFSGAAEYLGLKTTPVHVPPPAPMKTAVPPVARTAPPPANISSVVVPSAPPAVAPAAQPRPPTGPLAPAPSLSAEDDAEIAAQAARLKDLTPSSGPADFDAIVQQVLLQHNLAFHDDQMTKRAASLLKARLKDIRSADETTALMTRPPKVGGLGLDPDLAAAVTVALESSVQKAKERGLVRRPEAAAPPPPPRVPAQTQQKPAAMPPISRDFSTMKPDVTAAMVTESPRPSRPIMRPADIPPPPAMPNQAAAKPPVSVPVVTRAPAAQTAPSPAMQRPRSSDRPTTADILPPSAALGPGEEMRSYSLMQFRRLGQGAGDSARHLLDKFRHLQEESFSLWAEAVAGWRQSEVYRIYLDMGRQSLDQNKSIEQVIQQRAASGVPYLSEHEFNTLADMNRHLQV